MDGKASLRLSAEKNHISTARKVTSPHIFSVPREQQKQVKDISILLGKKFDINVRWSLSSPHGHMSFSTETKYKQFLQILRKRCLCKSFRVPRDVICHCHGRGRMEDRNRRQGFMNYRN